MVTQDDRTLLVATGVRVCTSVVPLAITDGGTVFRLRLRISIPEEAAEPHRLARQALDGVSCSEISPWRFQPVCSSHVAGRRTSKGS